MTRSTFYKFIFSILSFLLALLLIFSVFKYSFTNTGLSFSSFFNWLSSVQSPQISFNINDLYIYGDWGLFDGLRSFFNIFAQMLGVLIYLGTQLINLLIYVGQFISFLFA